MIELAERYYTKEEYFALQKEMEEKIEYHDGQVVAMAGGSPNHNLICLNIISELHQALKEKDCYVYNSDQQLFVDSENRFMYPDGMVVCGEQEFVEPKPLKLKNPILVIEVLSKSTSSYDKTGKFQIYRKIPSFKEYLLVHADRVLVESYFLEQPDLWRISSPYKLEDSIKLHSINVEIKLKDIYRKIKGLKEGLFI